MVSCIISHDLFVAWHVSDSIVDKANWSGLIEYFINVSGLVLSWNDWEIIAGKVSFLMLIFKKYNEIIKYN